MGNMIDGESSNLFELNGKYSYSYVNLTVQFPSIGPTYIHFYETSRKSNYLGRLLLSISSDVDTRTSEPIQYDVQAILPLLEVHIILFPLQILIFKSISLSLQADFWAIETFEICVVLFGAFHIERHNGRVRTQVRFAELASNSLEFTCVPYHKNGKCSYIALDSSINQMTIKVKMPDTRLKYQIDIFLEGLFDVMVI